MTMKSERTLAYFFASLVGALAFLIAITAHAQIVPNQNQQTTGPYGGIVLSTTTSATAKLGQILGTAYGDLLYWTGSRWNTIATSSLGISGGGPGGLNLQVQYNNSGVFGGISGAVTNGTILNLTNPLLGGATLTTSTVNGVTLTTGGSATAYLNGTGAYSVPIGTTYTNTYPITLTGNAFGIAFGTTTSNIWSGTQTFTNAPIFSSLTGVLKGNGASAVSVAANGTDYTLITAKTCPGVDFVSAVTAAGVFTCATPAGTTYTGTYPIQVSGSVISTAFSTTTQNNFNAHNTFTSLNAVLASTTNSTTTGSLYLTGVTASKILQTDANGKVIPLTVGSGLSFDGITLSASGGSGITSFGPAGQLQTGPAVTQATSTSAFNGLTPNLTITGAGNTLTYTSALSGTFQVGGGGTGLTSVSDGRILLGSSATALTSLATSTGGTILQTDFTTGRPSWVSTSTLKIALSDTTGVLAETRGGTNQSTYSTGDILYASAANTLSKRGIGTNGQILASALGIPTWVSTTTAGTGLTYNVGAPGNFSVNTSQNISTLSNLTSNGYIKTSGSTGALSVQGVPIPIADGGTLATSQTTNGVNYFDGTKITSGTNVSYDGTTFQVQGSGTNNTFKIIGSSAVSSGMYFQNTNAAGQAVIYVDNDRGSFASYGGLLNGSQSNVTGNIFGQSRADKVFLFADGASSLGLGIGTLTADPIFFGTNNTEAMRITQAGRVAIGSTTPGTGQALLISTSTGKNLTLSDGSLTANQWALGTINGILYIGTTSPSTYATNSPSAIQVTSAASTAVGIGATSSPWRTLSVVGTVGIDGLSAAAAGTVTVCIDTTTKELKLGGSAITCAPSSIRYKKDVATSTIGTEELTQLRPVTFYFKKGDNQQQLGFIAEEVYKIDPRLVQLGTDGLPQSLRFDNFISLIVSSVQEIVQHQNATDARIAVLEARIAQLEGNTAPICRFIR